MKHTLLLLGFLFTCLAIHGQETEGNFIKDKQSGCTVWFKYYFDEDSVTWSGNCTKGFASGEGTMIGYTKGKLTSKYIGHMEQGKPNGKGVFTFGADRILNGHFSNGEPLFLNDVCLNHLHKHIISETDSADMYVGDNGWKQLYYHSLIPEGQIKGAIVLMPGTWESTEHVISSTKELCELAYKNQLAVLVLSINQRLTLTDAAIALMNKMLLHAIETYRIPRNNIAIGGWSMGGLFSLRYTELAHEDSTKTAIKPMAVFSCDGPCDLENIYALFKKKLKKFPSNDEAAYGLRELEHYCNGSPNDANNHYLYFSCYSHAQNDGGNAKYLLNTPVRIYNDVDVNWWMENRGLDMYDMNALDQSAMILFLNEHENQRAEFINAYQKGYRIEGNRHPHSWSIVEPNHCIDWILNLIK